MSTTSSTSTADTADRYLQRRQSLCAHLDTVRRARAQWAAYTVNLSLPEPLRRDISRPHLPPKTVERLERILALALARLDEGTATYSRW